MYFLLAINQCFHDENEIVFRKVRTKSTEIPLIYVLALSSFQCNYIHAIDMHCPYFMFSVYHGIYLCNMHTSSISPYD